MIRTIAAAAFALSIAMIGSAAQAQSYNAPAGIPAGSSHATGGR